jgi:hypothetical protein
MRCVVTSKQPPRRIAFRAYAILAIGLVSCGVTHAQLAVIDRAKLPQDARVQSAYTNLLPIESLAQNWSPNWTSSTPKAQIVSQFSASLDQFRAAQPTAPENVELLLVTGLTAHFAYNLDVEADYEVAEHALERARQLAPTDPRPDWFLGMHYCQANEEEKGMGLLLSVEGRLPPEKLPLDFWDDYIACSIFADLPAHVFRAISRAENIGGPAAKYAPFAEMAKKRYKLADANSTYPSHDAWHAEHDRADVRFRSELCGLAFSNHADWHIDVGDVKAGTCVESISTGPYPSKSGDASPSLLVLTRPQKPQETLDDFVLSFLKKYPTAKKVSAPSCPASDCVMYEVVTDALYQKQGGAHLFIAGFAANPPEFPGLLLEQITPPPKGEGGEKPTYYRADPKLSRLPGVLYTIVVLDSNAAIFDRASADFEFLLKSIQLD